VGANGNRFVGFVVKAKKGEGPSGVHRRGGRERGGDREGEQREKRRDNERAENTGLC
jgi:hypothetical protein